MKKVLFFTTILAVLVNVITTAWAKEYEWLVFEEDVPFEAEILEVVDLLPKRVIRQFEKGCTIKVVSQLCFLQKKYGAPMAGCYDMTEQMVYVAACRYPGMSIEEAKVAVKGVTLHEIGHRYDCAKCGWSYSEEFEEIYNEEKEAFKTTTAATSFGTTVEYAVQNPQEFYANAFAMYIMYPQELADKCPKAYAFMQFVVERKGV